MAVRTPEDALSIVESDSLSLKFWPTFLLAQESRDLLLTLVSEVQWSQPELKIFGRLVKTPRLTCWYGDPDAVYTYSGLRNEPLPWTASLNDLRKQIQRVTGAAFNSVLLNLYRDGNDSMSWHSDDEPELGPCPVIASISLGATRRCDFRPKQVKPGAPRETRRIELTDGSLLLMTGETQRYWQHAVPKAPRVKGVRINLTFRRTRGSSAC